MANEHTEECLKKFSKPQLIAMVLSQRDETKATIQSLRNEVKEMNTNFKKLQADAKTVNNVLMKKSVDTEWLLSKCPVPSQRMFEIAGIPISISQQNLDEKVCQIFEAIGVSIDKNDTDDCHRLRDKDQTIVKFLQGKDCKQVLRCKKDLQSVNMSNLDLPEGPNYSLMKVYVHTVRVFGSFAKNCGTGSKSTPFLLLMVS